MKHYSEKELVRKNLVDLEYCSLLERDGTVSLDDLSELIPGYIHINDRRTLGLKYVSPKGLEKFEKSLDEVQAEGREFIDAIADIRSRQIFNTTLIGFSLNQQMGTPFSFIQRLRYTPDSPYLLFYTTTKHYRDNANLISYTQPLQMLRSDTFLKEVVEERYVFYSENYFRFAALTVREKEILGLIADGEENRRIADRLCISLETVRTHRKNICRKLETGKLIDQLKYAQVFLSK